jgi:hypothetical protein
VPQTSQYKGWAEELLRTDSTGEAEKEMPEQVSPLGRGVIRESVFDFRAVQLQRPARNGFPNSPTCEDQAGRQYWLGVAKSGESRTSNLLVGVTDARNDRAGELRWETFIEPLEGE